MFVDVMLNGLGSPRRVAAWYRALGPEGRVRAALPAAALLSGVLVAGALLLEHGMGVLPCKLCLVQRYPHYAILGLGLAGLALGAARLPPRLLADLRALFLFAAGIAFLYTGGYGVYHTGVERGWWPGPADCTAGGALPGSIDALNALFERGEAFVPCDAPPWTLLGLSLATWNMLISVPAAAAVLTITVAYLRTRVATPQEQHG